MASRFSICVKDVNGRSYLIRLETSWSVENLKREVARQASLPPDSFELVFAGSVLQEGQTLTSLGLQGYSTLHCIESRSSKSATGTQTTLYDVDLVSLSSANSKVKSPSSVSRRTQFYVYCKSPSCNRLQPGKLRVRCANCKNTGFILQNDPQGWHDVLTPGKLHGCCIAQGCDGKDAEFYFKCAAHDTGESENCVALHMIRHNTVGVECATCFTVQDIVVMFNTCHHCMCIACFISYLEDKVRKRDFIQCENVGYTVKCPAGCIGSEVKEIHHFRLLGKELYDRYQRFGAEDCVLQMGGLLCPQLNCGMGLLPDRPVRRVECPTQIGGCGFVFCRECMGPFHSGSCRQQTPATPLVENQPINIRPAAQWDLANFNYVKEMTKMCPNCHVLIEKNRGCRHMTCSRCKYEFCWICEIKWNLDCKSDHWFGDSDDDDEDSTLN